MTTALFMLRFVQIGLSIRDLDLLTIGMVNEMFIENQNDDVADKVYKVQDSQHDFDMFQERFELLEIAWNFGKSLEFWEKLDNISLI